MRDAFGGVFTMNLLLVFIFIFVAFAAVSLNYAKAFKLKNQIIDFIEEKEIIDLSEKNLGSKLEDLNKILQNADYDKTCKSINLEEGEIKTDAGTVTGYCYKGIVIRYNDETSIQGTSSRIIKYDITTYANWNLGALNKILVLGGKKENSEKYIAGSWAVNGEATVVTKIEKE